jgi:hypothetical protein
LILVDEPSPYEEIIISNDPVDQEDESTSKTTKRKKRDNNTGEL